MQDTAKPAIATSVQADLARATLVNAVFNLDEEGFNAIAWMIYQQAKTSGGYHDHEGWYRVLAACEALPFIAATQARFDEAATRADEAITVVEPIDQPPDIGTDVKGGGAV
jgi:hypothetical protein